MILKREFNPASQLYSSIDFIDLDQANMPAFIRPSI